MSSDTNNVTVLAVDGNVIDMRVRTGTAGGVNDYSLTRSFALVLLADCTRRAYEEDPKYKRTEPSILEKTLVESGGEYEWYKEAFMKEHVHEYIVRTEVLERHNVNEENDEAYTKLDAAMDAVRNASDLTAVEKEDRLSEVFHYIVLRAEVTDPKWLDGIEPGMVFGSTAFDAWWNDPERPPLPS